MPLLNLTLQKSASEQSLLPPRLLGEVCLGLWTALLAMDFSAHER
jgi:hypothetical protein